MMQTSDSSMAGRPDKAVTCPSCRVPMLRQSFPRKLGGDVELDLCFPCQGIWFDEFESLQLAPGGVVALFELIHRNRDQLCQPLAERLRCPRCDDALLHGLDRVKSGSFNYDYCLQRHGRFTSFAQFMIEKGFVRQASGAELTALQARIEVIRCTSCGAPVDIRRESSCGHCRSPITVLDPDAVESALAGYRAAEERRHHLDAEGLADALLLAETNRSRRRRERGALAGTEVGDLIVSGVEVVWGLLKT